ncbi:MAG: hypothetical protein IJP02_05090 [Oscillospiraceae bacterium]|nr:hypothetical protein [Oscillospiraceae bacterium]
MFVITLVLCMLPFVLFVLLNQKANTKREVRCKQYAMPILAAVYSAVLLFFMQRLSSVLADLFLRAADLCQKLQLTPLASVIRSIYATWGIYLELVLFNTASLLAYIVVKRVLTAIFARMRIKPEGLAGSLVGVFYSHDEADDRWYIKPHFGQARTFLKTAYYGCCALSALALVISCILCMEQNISAPFYPVFAIIILGELAFFIDGAEKDEDASSIALQADTSRRIAMYPLLRGPLRTLFGDKLSAEGTTLNNDVVGGSAIEDTLVDLEQTGGHLGQNYAAFIRRKMDIGLKPNADYVRIGYDLAAGKSLLFNTPFYDKLNPYVFYAMHRQLITGSKVLVVLGRHGTQADLLRWCTEGMRTVSNVPDLWKISVLSGRKSDSDELPDIGIITRSGVHDLDIHRSNLPFLQRVSFVMVIEPSRLVTTAQIGLNLLIKCCSGDKPITFCSVDRNCDGLVDALSHILMTNLTEVTATEYPHGTSSYMYWTDDGDCLQHRILPGVSRFLGMGTEFSMVALKNQVKETVWYGGDAFPVLDAHWIAKQYYYDLLNYAALPTNQETFDKAFRASFNMCDERVSDYSFITVEDDRNNLFETRRNFATISEQQGFVNVLSSEYMLREYMSSNPELFTADAKAIPYITADYARTRRNAILSLCLLLCIDSVQEDVLLRQLVMLNMDTKDPIPEIWKEICVIFGQESLTDKHGIPILSVTDSDGNTRHFERDDTIRFKRAYSEASGQFENVYTIEDRAFSRIILDDLQNASYIAEQEGEDIYIGMELKGHVYQKYMPGQFITLNGKYYEMISTTADNRILLRRASEHITGRRAYRQIRSYAISRLEPSPSIGTRKTVNSIDIHTLFADFSVETSGYWKLNAHNDFADGDLIRLNGVPVREYRHKQVLKLDFSAFGEAFTDSVRMTLTNLLNETFVTLFAENQPFICAVTPGSYDAPLTYSLSLSEDVSCSDQCIFIIEDSQLDIGLLVAVERNLERIFQIISDYLAWNDEQIEESLRPAPPPRQPLCIPSDEEPEAESAPASKKPGPFTKAVNWVKGLFGKLRDKIRSLRKPKPEPPAEQTDPLPVSDLTEDETDEPIPMEDPDTAEAAAEDEKEEVCQDA